MPRCQNVLVLGASGLIGRFITEELRLRGFTVTAIARRFAASQKASSKDVELPVVALAVDALGRLLTDHDVQMVVNCLGVLQDGPGMDTTSVHHDFTEKLLAAIQNTGRPIHLVHISIPGAPDDDRTAFSRTKRDAERMIANSGVASTILRPGFVIAPAAYGGSALLRALASLPIDVSSGLANQPFQPVAVADIAATIAWLCEHDRADGDDSRKIWELMSPAPATLGDVIAQFRHSFGTSDDIRLKMPSFLLDAGAKLGDLTALLGWTPPVRSTAIAELRRGVTGDPSSWMAATDITPTSLAHAVGPHSATIQDKWFARLFLIKPVIFASLALFWIVSGFIALVISYDAAAAILRSHDFPPALVDPITTGTSLMDMSIGCLIAWRRTSAVGLILGIIASLGYMFGSAVLAPDLWIEPLGALVKTGPAIVLMLIALLMLDNR